MRESNNTTMKQLRYLMILQLLMIYCCIGEVASNENGLKSNVVSAVMARNVRYTITVNLDSKLSQTSVKYLGVAADSSRIATKWTSSSKLQNLASALTPCEFRLGGTSADYIVFDPTNSGLPIPAEPGAGRPIPKIKMTGTEWDAFTQFIRTVGWDLMFNFNLFFWKADGSWDSTNADLLLNYSSTKGIRIPFFQLGNEPNSYYSNYRIQIPAKTLVQNFQILKRSISKYFRYRSSKLYGPDVSNIDKRADAKEYYEQFVAEGGYDAVSEYSIHHYYLTGFSGSLKDFLNVTVLESLRPLLELSLKISNAGARPLRVRLTETSSAVGGGTPGLSDRFVAGFLWLDKLGMAAQYGITRVYRQSFIGSSYALISRTFEPTPDYFLSLLFKKLIQGPVFNVTLGVFNPNLRVYAQCARRGIYSPGALVIYYLNLDREEIILSLHQYSDVNLDLYLLTSGDAGSLQSKYVRLLFMTGSTLPVMSPKPHRGKVTVDANSFGFIVIPQANARLCVDYFTTIDSLFYRDPGLD